MNKLNLLFVTLLGIIAAVSGKKNLRRRHGRHVTEDNQQANAPGSAVVRYYGPFEHSPERVFEVIPDDFAPEVEDENKRRELWRKGYGVRGSRGNGRAGHYGAAAAAWGTAGGYYGRGNGGYAVGYGTTGYNHGKGYGNGYNYYGNGYGNGYRYAKNYGKEYGKLKGYGYSSSYAYSF